MYKHLPRHTFGYVQGKLFPKDFQLGTILSSVTMCTYLIQNPLNDWDIPNMIKVRVKLSAVESYIAHAVLL